jgi:hypothetical protein
VIADDREVDLTGALARLRPLAGWPDRHHLLGAMKRSAMVGRFFGAPLAIWPFPSSQAVLVRDHMHPGGALSIGVHDGALELLVRIGRVNVATRDGCIVITLPFELPEAVAIAGPGRSIGTLVSHRWFADRAWIIDSVRRQGDRTTISVIAGYELFAMPWARLLRASPAPGRGEHQRACHRG